MTKTAKEILNQVYLFGMNGGLGYDKFDNELSPDQALKELEAIIGQAEPGTWVDPDDTDDLEWQGYVKGVQDYKDNLRQALYGKEAEL